MIVLDANLLVYAHVTAFGQHERARAWLDDRLQDIRRGGWRNATRSALIRALIRAAIEQDPDLAGVSGERELSQRLTTPKA